LASKKATQSAATSLAAAEVLDAEGELLAGAEVAAADFELELLGLLLPQAAAPRPSAHASTISGSGR
jgi:hypothetical protein